jgi:hypothetical protein
MDVASLYTNIPHDEGIAACRKIWEQRTVQEPPTECLVELFIAMYPLHVNVVYKSEP